MGACCCCCCEEPQPPLSQQAARPADSVSSSRTKTPNGPGLADPKPSPDSAQEGLTDSAAQRVGLSRESTFGQIEDVISSNEVLDGVHAQAQDLARYFTTAGVDAEFALAVLRDYGGDSQMAWNYLLRYRTQQQMVDYERAVRQRGEDGIAESQNYVQRLDAVQKGQGVVVDGRCTGVVDSDDHGVLVRSHSGYLADELNARLVKRGLQPECSNVRARELLEQFAPGVTRDEPNRQLDEAHGSIDDMVLILQSEQVESKVFTTAIRERGEDGIAESQNYVQRLDAVQKGQGVVVDGRCTGVVDSDDHGVLVRSHSGFIADELDCSIQQARAYIDKYAGPEIPKSEPNRQLEVAYASLDLMKEECLAAAKAVVDSGAQATETVRVVIFGGEKPEQAQRQADQLHESYVGSGYNMVVDTFGLRQGRSLLQRIKHGGVDVLINLKWAGHSDTEKLNTEMKKWGRLVLQKHDELHMCADLEKHYPIRKAGCLAKH